jgi:hypothetical protein
MLSLACRVGARGNFFGGYWIRVAVPCRGRESCFANSFGICPAVLSCLCAGISQPYDTKQVRRPHQALLRTLPGTRPAQTDGKSLHYFRAARASIPPATLFSDRTRSDP